MHIDIIFVFLNIAGIFPFSSILLKKATSHDLVRTPQCLKNSGNISSLPADFPVLIFAITEFISSNMKGAYLLSVDSSSWALR
jgi:hypothetical protein